MLLFISEISTRNTLGSQSGTFLICLHMLGYHYNRPLCDPVSGGYTNYFLIVIHPQHWKYHHFALDTKHCQSYMLSFSISVALKMFTKRMAAVTAFINHPRLHNRSTDYHGRHLNGTSAHEASIKGLCRYSGLTCIVNTFQMNPTLPELVDISNCSLWGCAFYLNAPFSTSATNTLMWKWRSHCSHEEMHQLSGMVAHLQSAEFLPTIFERWYCTNTNRQCKSYILQKNGLASTWLSFLVCTVWSIQSYVIPIAVHLTELSNTLADAKWRAKKLPMNGVSGLKSLGVQAVPGVAL